MGADQAAEILRNEYGIETIVETDGRLTCIMDISKQNIFSIRNKLKELGYVKSWGIRPKRTPSGNDLDPIVLDDPDSCEKHAI